MHNMNAFYIKRKKLEKVNTGEKTAMFISKIVLNSIMILLQRKVN